MRFKNVIPIICILLLAAVLRFLWLDRVPAAINGDELTYILTIKSIALSGRDLSGPWNIFSALFFQYPQGFPQAELSYFLLYPAIAFTPFALFTSKITYAVVSLLTVIAMYLLAGKLFDKKTAIIAAFITAINPWQIFNGRTSYEMVPATFFYILAIYFLLKEKGNRILIAFPFFLLAFYSYIATKIILVPIVVTVSIFAYFQNNKKFGKQYIALNIACVILILFFSLMLSRAGNSRAGEIFTPSFPEVARQVDIARRSSVAPNSISNLLNNKITVYIRILIEKTFKILSLDYLFISTDNFVSIFNHGLFYYLDSVFLFLGTLFLFAKKKKVFLLISVLISLSIIPHVLHLASLELFTPHLTLFLTFLILPISYGISELVKSYKSKVVIGFVVFLYIISLANFVNVYFFQFPLIGSFDFPSREVSNYVRLAGKSGEKIDLYVQFPIDSFKKYLYYADALNDKTISSAQKAISQKKYQLGNVSFYSCGDISKNLSATHLVIYQSGICPAIPNKNPYIMVARLNDGGQIYRIYNDKICSKYSLRDYPKGIRISDFSIESLSTQNFCEAFITRQ